MKLIFCMLVEIQAYTSAYLGSISATFYLRAAVSKLCHQKNFFYMYIKIDALTCNIVRLDICL